MLFNSKAKKLNMYALIFLSLVMVPSLYLKKDMTNFK